MLSMVALSKHKGPAKCNGPGSTGLATEASKNQCGVSKNHISQPNQGLYPNTDTFLGQGSIFSKTAVGNNPNELFMHCKGDFVSLGLSADRSSTDQKWTEGVGAHKFIVF